MKTYDTRCFDLAETFLEDEPHLNTPTRLDELAALIQSTIEGYIENERLNYDH